MDIDQSLEDIISSRKGPAAPAPGSDRPSSRNNRPQSGPGGGGISRRGRGGGRPSERSGRSERENGIRLPYSRDRPPTRSSEDSWTHDMYNPRGASNDDDMRGGGAGAVRSGNPTYQRAPRGGGGGGNDDNTRLVVSNVHYEVTKEDLESIFSRTGKIVTGPTIRYDRSGRSTGIAFIEYATPRQARDAIDSFDGNLAKGQALHIKYDDSPIRVGRATSSPGGSLLSRIEGVPSVSGGRRGGRDGESPIPVQICASQDALDASPQSMSSEIMSRRDDEPGPSTRLPPQTPAPEEDVAVTTPSSARRRTPTRKGKERMYACDEPDCGKMFSKPAKLIEHSRSHTGERPYVCPTCSAAYLRSSHLTAHQRTHLNPEDKEYQCAVDGCGKTFWTEQHLRRHEKGHDVALVYQCPSCPISFPKHHQLRSHIAVVHSTPGTKPFQCSHPGCEWSFETNQKLKVHSRIHDDSRYVCSHPSHGEETDSWPHFRTWTDLRQHTKEEHPPTCPHPECVSRTFKKTKNLREHMKVHAERGDELPEEEEEEDEEPSDSDEELDADQADQRKRLRGSEDDEVDRIPKRLKRSNASSSVGKEWLCGEDDCAKGFKSKRALSVHHSTAHLGLRPFVCPDPDCTNSYGHKHLLQRHVSSRHRRHHDQASPIHQDVDASKLIPTQPEPKSDPTSASAFASPSIDLLTGAHYDPKSTKHLQCPCLDSDHKGGEDESAGRCPYRFSRLYDLRRHLKKVHKVELDDDELKVLLKDAARSTRKEVKGRKGSGT